MKIKSLVLASVAFAALAAPALAQQGTPPTPEERAASFDKADANKDGKLDMAEFKASLGDRAAQMDDARLKAIFDRRDTDKDGKLSKAEFTAPMQRPAQ
jgi:Ca2+-binding EF-hand superfamily protein